MEYGDNLTLKQAADFSEVSEVTMRSWAKEIPNIQRYPGGGYAIPRTELMAFLATKRRRNFGATKSSQVEDAGSTFSPDSSLLYRELIDEIKGERDTLKQDLASARDRINNLERQNDMLSADILSLTREMRELIFGEGKPGLSRWMPYAQGDQRSRTSENDPNIIEAESLQTQPRPITRKKKTPSKSPVKGRAKSKTKVKTKSKPTKKATSKKRSR